MVKPFFYIHNPQLCYVLYLYGRLELERDLQEYEKEQQVNAQYVEEFAMLTSEKVSS